MRRAIYRLNVEGVARRLLWARKEHYPELIRACSNLFLVYRNSGLSFDLVKLPWHTGFIIERGLDSAASQSPIFQRVQQRIEFHTEFESGE